MPYVIDRDRYTCTGGVAPLDFMMHLVTPRIGRTIAAGISWAFIVERIRDSTDRQHVPLAARLGGSYPPLTLAAELMEANMEAPLSIGELAQLCQTSQRQLQRLFRRNLSPTPEQYCVTVCLGRARRLLQQTSMSVMDIRSSHGLCFARGLRPARGPCRELCPIPAQLVRARPADVDLTGSTLTLHDQKGARKSQHSIRTNDQFRVCFTWTDAGPRNVAIVDYH